MLTSFSMINADPDTYARCHEILGIPEGVEWADIKVEFGTDMFGTVTLELMVTGEQIRDLATLAIRPNPSPCAD